MLLVYTVVVSAVSFHWLPLGWLEESAAGDSCARSRGAFSVCWRYSATCFVSVSTIAHPALRYNRTHPVAVTKLPVYSRPTYNYLPCPYPLLCAPSSRMQGAPLARYSPICHAHFLLLRSLTGVSVYVYHLRSRCGCCCHRCCSHSQLFCRAVGFGH
jgi:hypothetical protein